MERRKQGARRHRRRVEVRYGIDMADFTGYSGNISRTGVMVRSTRVFAPGTVLNLELRFSDRTVKLRGRVTWAREGSVQLLSTGRIGMGVHFLDPPGDLDQLFQ